VEDVGEVGEAVSGRGAGRDARPVLAAASAAEPDPGPGGPQERHLRWKQRLGPVQIGDRLNMPASTVHAVLVRCRINRLTHVDRATGEPVRRYQHEHPGDLLHVDVKKLGNVPDGGGWRYVGKQQGDRNRSATVARTGTGRSKTHGALIGTAFVHTVIDDYSRVAYVEIHDDERQEIAALVLAAPLHCSIAGDAEARPGVRADQMAGLSSSNAVANRNSDAASTASS
jgi:hypothetical protein